MISYNDTVDIIHIVLLIILNSAEAEPTYFCRKNVIKNIKLYFFIYIRTYSIFDRIFICITVLHFAMVYDGKKTYKIISCVIRVFEEFIAN